MVCSIMRDKKHVIMIGNIDNMHGVFDNDHSHAQRLIQTYTIPFYTNA